MHEILFRGQTRRFGEMVNAFSGKPIPSMWVCGGIFPQNGNGDRAIIYQQEPEFDKFSVYADTVGQYIGRNDIDDKRIFEGDIVNAFTKYSPTHSGTETGVIFWDGERCGFRLRNRLGNVFDINMFDDLKIIGNIYDNPEILKGDPH